MSPVAIVAPEQPAAPALSIDDLSVEALQARAEAVLILIPGKDEARQNDAIKQPKADPEAALARSHAPAAMRLAFVYEAGLGVPRDFTHAITLYRQAGEPGVEQGFRDAMLLSEQIGRSKALIDSFFAFCKASPHEGRMSLDSMSSQARIAVQRCLGAQGTFRGVFG